MPHIHEKTDFTAEVFVVHGNKVLLRKHDKYDMWLGAGGHIELGEDPTEAAVREVKEEVGLDVDLIGEKAPQSTTDRELIPPAFMNRHRISDTHEHVTMIYFARCGTDEVRQPDGHEVSEECKWFTREELESNGRGVGENIRFYALKALEAAKNQES